MVVLCRSERTLVRSVKALFVPRESSVGLRGLCVGLRGLFVGLSVHSFGLTWPCIGLEGGPSVSLVASCVYPKLTFHRLQPALCRPKKTCVESGPT